MASKPAYQVTCHTPDDLDPDRRIEGLGGPGNGKQWWLPIDELISGIERGAYDLWTVTPERQSVWVVVAVRNGRKYLKTEADGLEPNNLLALRHC
ncbi:DUF3892 domain-containing protein [Phenylobacterium sp.]|uniref:DUF3892 domain-containing protein n=1 Tax=Phenylobacterium sp. TaxID=1871053 RepID=UPI003FA7722A